MNEKEAILHRHSVRAYSGRQIEEEKLNDLRAFTACINREGNLSFQLVLNEEKAFSSLTAHYGRFRGVRNYIALVAGKDRDEDVGYYGEKLVLHLTELGLSSCWVALTFRKIKSAYRVNNGEKLYLVVAFGGFQLSFQAFCFFKRFLELFLKALFGLFRFFFCFRVKK